MKPQKEKLHLEGLTRTIDSVAKVRKIIQIFLMKIKYIFSCCHFSVMWSSTPRREKSMCIYPDLIITLQGWEMCQMCLISNPPSLTISALETKIALYLKEV